MSTVESDGTDIALTPDMIEIMEQCAFSTGNYAQVFLPERFYRPFSSLHHQIFDAIDDPRYQLVLILAPRGFGKTSTCTIAYPARNITYGLKKFVVPVSATSTSAELQSENLKKELITNNNIEVIFGPQKTPRWSMESWISASGTMVMPRGAGQQIRGLLHGHSRPDLIICDDLETPEGVRSEEQRAKLLEWFMSDVMGSVDQGSKNWKVVIVGTVLHEDSLLMNLLKHEDFHKVVIELCTDDLKSNWPDFMSDEQIAKLYERYEKAGKLDTFYREYRNKPISAKDAVFKQSYFKYFEEPLSDDIKRDLVHVVIMDPAKTVKMHSADSAIVCIAVNRQRHEIYIRDIVNGKFFPDELYNKAFEVATKWNARILAYEVTGLNEFIEQPMNNEKARRGSTVMLLPLKARGKKEERVAQLVSYYRNGFIYHNKDNCKVLEQQLLSFPASALWDVMDATAYIIPIMDSEYQYFYPPDFDADSNENLERLYDDLLKQSDKALVREAYI